jgi:PKD repeat protein
LFGIHGTITNAVTGLPVRARVVIHGHDTRNSHVYSDENTGYYVRLLKAGTYTVTYIADGYDPEVRTITVVDNQRIIQNIQLNYSGMTVDFSANRTEVDVNGQVTFINETFSEIPIISYSWVFEGGTPSTSAEKNPVVTYAQAGHFDVSLTVSNGNQTKTVTKENFIHVASHHNMHNGTIYLCGGFFFDEGGPTGNYLNNSNLTMTIMPATEDAFLRVTFLEFDVEDHFSCSYDFLRIYNGPTTSSPLFGTFCGRNLPGPFESTAADGSLTFMFRSDGSVVGAGWMAYVECIARGGEPVTILTVEENKLLNIYPNPAKDALTIEAKSIIQEIEIIDMRGRRVLRQKNNTNKITINLDNIPQGAYLLKTKVNNRHTTTKIIICE